MAKRNGQGEAVSTIGTGYATAGDLAPNPWNPNVMDPEMFQKEIASIERFGFVDPITVRPSPVMRETGLGPMWQIIDGEHRMRAGIALGMDEFPIVVLDVDEPTAQELTIVLNETRGKPDEVKLADLVRSLAAKRDEQELHQVLPFTAEKMRTMLSGVDPIDWDALRDRRDKLKKDRGRWVERVYRMPVEVAKVVDDAVSTMKDREGIEQDWQALELMAADVLASR